MTANEIPVGYGFVGTIESVDWSAGNRKKLRFDGGKIRVVAMFPAPIDEDEVRLVMNLYAGLAFDKPLQLSSDIALWVAGARPKRSRYCRVVDWKNRCSIGAAESVISQFVRRDQK